MWRVRRRNDAVPGDKATLVGPIGAGTVAKLSHNWLGCMFLESMAELFSLAVKAGMDPLDLSEAMQLMCGCDGRRRPGAAATGLRAREALNQQTRSGITGVGSR